MTERKLLYEFTISDQYRKSESEILTMADDAVADQKDFEYQCSEGKIDWPDYTIEVTREPYMLLSQPPIQTYSVKVYEKPAPPKNPHQGSEWSEYYKTVPVKLVGVTAPMLPQETGVFTAEELMVYCARVSNPKNQSNMDTAAKLLKYCYENGHWSVFEQADMTVEITTSRAIAQQILRHRSFTFQEFSQRYAEVTNFCYYEPRRQDVKNRQNSIDDLTSDVKDWFLAAQSAITGHAKELYEEALGMGIAKESARFLLPLSTQTRLYMKGSVRSWLHYLGTRMDASTQLEHREIAQMIFGLFSEEFPITAGLLNSEGKHANPKD